MRGAGDAMNALKRHSRESRAYRDYQEFMLDLLNLMSRAYAAELHQAHGFGAARLSKLTKNVIATVHAAISRYEGEYTQDALDMWCRDFGFDATVGLDRNGAVEFKGGIIERK